MKNEQIKNKFIEKALNFETQRILCRWFEPAVKEGEEYPLVVYLHGGGECGNDTTLVLKNNGAVDFAAPEWQAKHPCYIVAPQCPEGMSWTSEENVKLVIKSIESLAGQYPIDNNRIYLTGIAMGGEGTWHLITKYPDVFAAAMPVCGAGVPKDLSSAKSLPVWAFHAADDPVVPVSASGDPRWKGMSGTRRMVIRLRSIGNRQVRYTEYPPGTMEKQWGVSPHSAWVAAYSDQEALTWLFEQNRLQRYDIEFIMPGIWQIGDCWFGAHFYILEGADKALVIDTGMVKDAMGIVKSLTRLPVELIATHVHFDHISQTDQFGKFYMSKKDSHLWDFYKSLLPDNTSVPEDIVDIKDGGKIDLGGGVVVEAFELPGHSPGSLMLIDRYHGVCFAGDTAGNGEYVWAQVPGSLNLSDYKASIDRFLNFLDKEGLNDIVFLGGHRRQEWWDFPECNHYNPLCRELLEDLSTLITLVLNDEVTIAPSPVTFHNDATLRADYGMAILLFRQENKK